MRVEPLLAATVTRGLRKFSNAHLGEACYIFGDGPSIKWFDFALLGDLPAICCGMIPFHKDFQRLNVRYASFVAPWIFLPSLLQPRMYHAFRGIAMAYKELVRLTPELNFFIHWSNAPVVSGRNVTYVSTRLPRVANETDRLLRTFNLFGGSFHSSLSLAYFLGFRTVYLAGFDAWTIQPSRNLHWYELGEGEPFDPTNFAEAFLAALKREMDIYTLSVTGGSRNVKNVSYLSHTGQQPRFRENHQLIERRYLDVLATYPSYKIFGVESHA